MAEGFLKKFDKNLTVYSAGTDPAHEVHPKAVIVMADKGIDLNKNYPKNINEFLDQEFDHVITVCGGAKESCPNFSGKVKNQIHIGFDDPADATGTEEEIFTEFLRIRNEIERDFYKFYKDRLI